MARPDKQQQQVAAAVVLVALLLVCSGTAPTTPVSGAVTCAQVVRDLTPCISYAMGAGGAGSAPGQDCCAGIKSLDAAAGTAADRQATCACLKQATASMGALKPDVVAAIPGKCGVAIPYPISRTTDCSKYVTAVMC
ncbi:non-specific lipid-transfer protein 4-like [Miscanthus floridulus]|uniref:non-specific lipid-transfer protein 4-like n=1 Tax=Miscanthus floridulus TaxID=154761 RepID=UPI0034577BC3